MIAWKGDAPLKQERKQGRSVNGARQRRQWVRLIRHTHREPKMYGRDGQSKWQVVVCWPLNSQQSVSSQQFSGRRKEGGGLAGQRKECKSFSHAKLPTTILLYINSSSSIYVYWLGIRMTKSTILFRADRSLIRVTDSIASFPSSYARQPRSGGCLVERETIRGEREKQEEKKRAD